MRKKEKRTAMLLMAPAVIGFFVFYVLPMGVTLKNSFFFRRRVYRIRELSTDI